MISPILGAATSVMCSSLMGISGIFPVPFALVGVVVPGIIVGTMTEVALIPTEHRNTFQKLLRIGYSTAVLAVAVMLILVYIGYRIVFLRLDDGPRAGFALVLPVIRFALQFLCSRMLVRFAPEAVMAVNVLFEVYHTFFFAVLFANEPGVEAFLVMIATDWLSWISFLWHASGSVSRFRILRFLDPYDVVDEDGSSPGVSSSNLSLGDLAHLKESPATQSDSSLPTAAGAGAVASASSDSSAGTASADASMDAFLTRNGNSGSRDLESGSSSDNQKAKASGHVRDASVASSGGNVLASSSSSSSVHTFWKRPLPHERRRLFIAGLTFNNLLALVVIPLQYIIYISLSFYYADTSHFYFMEDMTRDTLVQGVIYNVVHVASQLLAASIVLPIYYRLFKIPFFEFGRFYLGSNLYFFITMQITCIVSILGISLKHFGDDFTFQFLWLHSSDPPPS